VQVPVEECTDIEAFKEIPLFTACEEYDNRLSTIASAVEFIYLDPEPPFNDFMISDVSISDQYVFLSDIYKIIQYDRKGKYIRQIGSRGMGPEEFVQLSLDIQVDEERELIYALDVRRNRILMYDFDGNFKKVISLYDHSSFFDIVDSTRIVFRSGLFDRWKPNCPLIRFIDYNGKHKKTVYSHLYPVDKNDMERHGSDINFLWKHRNNAYYLEYGSDTIFRIQQDTLIPIRKLIGNLSMDFKEHFKKNSGKKIDILGYLMRSNAAIFESDQFIIFKLSADADNEQYYKVYNKSTQQFHRTFYKNIETSKNEERKMNFFIDDIISGLHFTPQYQSREYAISLIPAATVCERRQKILDFMDSHPTGKSDSLRVIVKNFTEDDNALVMITTFK
jgi:hypothetical protein